MTHDKPERVQAEALEEQFREQFKGGRLIRHNLWDYWVALDGKTGDLGYEWSDKPHRLVFDLLHHAVAQENQIRELTAALASLPEAPAVPVATDEMAEKFSAGVDKYWKGRKSGRDGDAIMAGLQAALATPPAPTAEVDGEVLEALRESIRQLDVIIEDGIQTDFRAWRDDLRAALSKAHLSPGTADIPDGEPVARCYSAVSPCSWQRHHGMESVCPTCVAAASPHKEERK